MGEQSNVSSKTCVSNKNLQNKPLICFNNFEDKFLESKLEDICTFYKGKGISKEDISPEGIPCIRYGELYTKYKENIESIFSKTNLPKETLVFSEKGDILIPTSGESAEDIATASCLNRGGIALGSDITILRTKINSLYLAYYINFKKNEIAKLAQGVSIVHLYPKDLKEYKIKYPSLEEQEKVVNFLKLIDLKINSLEKTLGLYEKNKKYFIENIFSQKLRFEGFPKEWDFMYLKDIGTFFRGHSYNSNNVVEDGLLVLRSNNIQNGKLIFDKDRLQFVNKPCNDELKLIRNDIVICMSNGTKSLVGKTAQYDGSYPNELTVGAFCSIFRSNAPLAKYIFQTEYFKKYLYILLAGTNINNIKNSDLEKFIIKLPGYEEQEKITKFLNNFNKKIELIKLKKEKYENYKKSLLQNMFV